MLGFLKFGKSDDEEFKEAMKNAKPLKGKTSRKIDDFIKTEEAKKLIKEWSKKGFKKRGVTALLMILWLHEGSDKKALKAAKDILSKLKGTDLFARFLDILKLAPEEKMA